MELVISPHFLHIFRLTLLSISTVLSPLVIITCFFMMGGIFKLPGIIIFFAYLIHLSSIYLANKNLKFYAMSVIALIAIGYAVMIHQNFWKIENQNTCMKIKSDPYCTESDLSFKCSIDSSVGDLTVRKSICNQ